MTILEAIILGIIQGITEFLPVSSSGHLELGKELFGGMDNHKDSLQMSVVLHCATAMSTLIVFRKDIIEIFKNVLNGQRESIMFVYYIVLSMIPVAIVALFFEDELESFFGSNLLYVGVFLILTACLLFISDRAPSKGKDIGTRDAIIVGLAQAVALLPGISRSGSTIATSLLLGINKEKAARFSFLMVIPLIFGKMGKDIISGDFEFTTEGNGLPLLAGFFAALFTGIIFCTWMIKLVKNSKLIYFAIYCFIVGTIAVVYTILK